MKQILMRMTTSPFDNDNLYSMVSKDKIGSNSGNLLFPYSIMRNIYKDGDVIDKYPKANEEDADRINENYDLFLIPLANAFRESFVSELRNLTKLIKRLTIPCVVVGVGLQTKYEPKKEMKYAFDTDVKNFVEAVLEKSKTLGVRGEITALYLKKLGFNESKIEVIGCPSMFTWGGNLPRKIPFYLTNKTAVSISYHGNADSYFNFLERCKREYSSYYIILQGIYDLRLLYAGDSIQKDTLHPLYVKEVDNRSYYENHLRMFINVPSWIKFLNDNVQLGIGSCIHGSIASVLAGNPTFVFAADSRVRELAEYHHIPMMKMTDIDEQLTLEEIYIKNDFNSVFSGHQNRYKVFGDFLKANGIEFQAVENKLNTDFDKRIFSLNLESPEGVGGYIFSSYKEQIEHLNKYLNCVEGKIKWWIKEEKSHKNAYSERLQWERSRKCILDRIERMK